MRDAGEACDDGNTESCDGCSASCGVETGCGDGVRCGVGACDDGNTASCDGCSPACTAEIGARCGDGTVNTACGEECDPPGPDCSATCTRTRQPLGTRRFTFGGSFYSSALGPEIPLGTLDGAIDLVAGVPGADGIGPISVNGPVYYSAAILNGVYGYLCVRIDACTGFIDCDGGTAVDTHMTQDSNGAGINGGPVMLETGLGDDGGAGAVQLECQQTFVQLAPGAGSDCLNTPYPPVARIVYTTGTVNASFLNGNPRVGDGMITAHGEPFDCAAWTTTDGPGILSGTYLVEENPQAGDVANANVLDD